MIWICYSRALERRCLRERRKERWRGSCKFELRVGASSVHLLFSSAAANLRFKIIQERTDLWKVLRTFSNDLGLGGLRLRAEQAVDFITNPLDDDITGRVVVYFRELQNHEVNKKSTHLDVINERIRDKIHSLTVDHLNISTCALHAPPNLHCKANYPSRSISHF